MKILINDMIQYSDAPEFLKTPALADDGTVNTLTITFSESVTINCIGVGNTNADSIIINGETVIFNTGYDKNGLYDLVTILNTDTVAITLVNGDTLGRLGLGVAHKIGSSPAREPAYWSTNSPRTTLSGQVIAGVGGVTGREIQVDFRYKFTEEIFNDIESAYQSQIGRGFPFFISFTDCSSCIFPWERLYATTDKNWMFQSSVNRFLYSKKLQFKEAF